MPLVEPPITVFKERYVTWDLVSTITEQLGTNCAYRPDLCIGSEGKSLAADGKHQVLQLGEVGTRNLEKVSSIVKSGTSRLLVLAEGIYDDTNMFMDCMSRKVKNSLPEAM